MIGGDTREGSGSSSSTSSITSSSSSSAGCGDLGERFDVFDSGTIPAPPGDEDSDPSRSSSSSSSTSSLILSNLSWASATPNNSKVRRYKAKDAGDVWYSASWVLRCARRLQERANFFWQMSHANGLSPECSKRWFFRFVCLLNPRWQTWHL